MAHKRRSKGILVMKHKIELDTIAYIRTEFPTKFGIPRQSGLADTRGTIVFEPEYQNTEALRGIEEYSHLWLIWGFSDNFEKGWHPTVRPPRLGGNERVGVFATRSPFRPNPLGLSSVRLLRTEKTATHGVILHVEGADLKDGTPIYDIKPYLSYVDAHMEASDGFADEKKNYELQVEIPENLGEKLTIEQRKNLRQILSQDPRPSYQNDPKRIYGMEYAGMEIRFRVEEGHLSVCEILQNEEEEKATWNL